MQYIGPSVPALAQAAEQQGKRAGSNVAAEINDGPPVAFRYRSVGQLVDLGEGSAVVDILGVKLGGLVRARSGKASTSTSSATTSTAHVLADWTIDLFTRPDTSKLFEDPKRNNRET